MNKTPEEWAKEVKARWFSDEESGSVDLNAAEAEEWGKNPEFQATLKRNARNHAKELAKKTGKFGAVIRDNAGNVLDDFTIVNGDVFEDPVRAAPH